MPTCVHLILKKRDEQVTIGNSVAILRQKFSQSVSLPFADVLSEPLEIRSGQIIDGLVFEYDDGLATIEGRVVSMDGRPITNAIISEQIAGLDMKRTTTNEKGEFSVMLLRGELITLVAETAEGRLRGKVTSLAGAEKSVEIQVRD